MSFLSNLINGILLCVCAPAYRTHSINRSNSGARTVAFRNVGVHPIGIAIDNSNGDILIADLDTEDIPDDGALIQVNWKTSILSDFGNAAQGPTGVDPRDVAIQAAPPATVTETTTETITTTTIETIRGGSSLAVVSSPRNPATNKPVTFTVTLLGDFHGISGPLPNELVTLSAFGQSGTCMTGKSGSCQVTLTAPATGGTYSVTAQFAGDSYFAPCSSTLTLDVRSKL